MRKPKLTVVLRILLSLSLLALLLWLGRENFAKIRQLLSSLNLSVFTLAFLLFIISIIFMAWRLRIVLAAQETSFSIKDLFSLTLIGHFFTNFMPTSVGGDLVKGYYISRRIKSKISSYASVFVDRIMGMFSLILIASIALLIMRKDIEHKFIFWALGLLLLFCIIFTLLLINKKLLKRIGGSLGLLRLLRSLKLDSLAQKAYVSVNVYTNHKKKLLQMLILSIAAQFIAFFAIYILSNSLSVYIPFGKILLVMPIIAALCMLPVTMNGLGLREWAFVFFFSPNVGEAAALSLSLLYLAMFLLTSLIGGIIYLFWR
ncbi:MAG: flippase-like domain-containing protein [Candidatus Omnitrophica bacterium]|nr:flippase-like domain-containing protein [Candidatus Omnitrophota bacterium]